MQPTQGAARDNAVGAAVAVVLLVLGYVIAFSGFLVAFTLVSQVSTSPQ